MSSTYGHTIIRHGVWRRLGTICSNAADLRIRCRYESDLYPSCCILASSLTPPLPIRCVATTKDNTIPGVLSFFLMAGYVPARSFSVSKADHAVGALLTIACTGLLIEEIYRVDQWARGKDLIV